MPDKLDPALSELVETAGSSAEGRSATIDVMVGIETELDDAARDDLAARGLAVRSEVGTVLTGSIMIGDVGRLAESANVVKLEASAPLHLESNEGVGDG